MPADEHVRRNERSRSPWPRGGARRSCAMPVLSPRGVLASLALGASVALCGPAGAQSADGKPESNAHGHPDLLAPAKGDLPEMQAAHVIRVLVSFNSTEFFIDSGRPRGFEYELMHQYEIFLNRNLGKDEIRTDLVYIPLPFEEILTALENGRGDVAAAGITITAERQETVDFTIPYVEDVNEVIVTHAPTTRLESLDELSGRRLYVLRASSFVEHLHALNQRFQLHGRPPVDIVESDPYLSLEDILEMVNAGIHQITVADSHVANLWAKVLPKVEVNDNLAIHSSGNLAWAVRQTSPKLLASLNEFLKSHRQGTKIGNVLFTRYFESTRWIKNPLLEDERDKLVRYRPLFEKYAERYGFDWLLIAALAYQESGLDPKRKSHRGAVGIMQVRPSTAADRNIDVPDVHKLENNVHAGVKYLAFLRDRYFSTPEITPDNSLFFSLAAYNAGPARVRRLQKDAARNGLDPDMWFANVELEALEEIGRETVRYVSNVYKYYLAYRSISNIAEQRSNVKPPA